MTANQKPFPIHSHLISNDTHLCAITVLPLNNQCDIEKSHSSIVSVVRPSLSYLPDLVLVLTPASFMLLIWFCLVNAYYLLIFF